MSENIGKSHMSSRQSSTTEYLYSEHKYRLMKTLGIGASGKVKLAVHIPTGQKVAIKIMNRQNKQDMEEKVRRGITLHMKLVAHPHVMRLYEVIETPFNICLVMEYVKSGDLFDYIVQNGRLSEDESRRFFQQIIAGVDHCHTNHVVHRDLRPEKLLLDQERSFIKIADFRSSNMMRDGQFLKTSCGSPNYAAPEMIQQHPYAGPEVDVWSCGVILYAMLCGALPFDDENMSNLFRKVIDCMYNLPSHLSVDARDLITSMLKADPLQRITIAEIRRHPFFRIKLPRYIALPSAETAYQVKRIDEDIIFRVEKMGFERMSLVQSLLVEEQSKATAAYYLLLDSQEKKGLNEFFERECEELVESSVMKEIETSSKNVYSSPHYLAQEIMKIGNIDEVFNNHVDLQSLLHGEETIILCCFDTKDNLFEFYFKNCEDMVSVVGVGLEYAKAILVEGWEVKIKEILKIDWEQAWNREESSSTTLYKLLKLELCSLHHVNKEVDSGEFQNFIARPLLWDLAKYFTLKETITTFGTKGTYANCAGGSNSNSQNLGEKSVEGYDENISSLGQAFIKWSGLRKKENDEENNDDERNQNREKEHVDPNQSCGINADTTVSIELLSGGHILGESNFDEETRQKLRSLDRTIVPNLEFIFVHRDGIKEVQVKVGYICFNLGWNGFHEHGETRLIWCHENFKVSFGLLGVAQNFGELVRNSFEHLDVKKGTENMKASHTVEKKKGKEIAVRGGFDGKPYGVGFTGHIEGKISTLNGDIQQVETFYERSCDLSQGGLIFKQIIDPDDCQIACEYIFPHSKDIYADLHRSPMCDNQAVKFQGIWIPLDDRSGYSPSFVEYSLKASRCLQEIVSKRKDNGNEHRRRRKTIQEESLQATYEQIYVKTILINHVMTHLDGKAYKLRERRGEILGTSYLTEQRSMRLPQWNDPLLKLERFS